MKRVWIVLLCVLLTAGAACADALPLEERVFWEVWFDGAVFTLGESTLADFADRGWQCSREDDGAYSLYEPRRETYAYARTLDGSEDAPLIQLDLQWADGVPGRYLGFGWNTDDEGEAGGNLMDWLEENLYAREDETGAVTAFAPLSGGRTLSIRTKGRPVCLTLETLRLSVDGTPVAVAWEENRAVDALREAAAVAPLRVSMRGGENELSGSLGRSLPQDDEQTAAEPGDILLCAGDQLVILSGGGDRACTRLGRILDPDAAGLPEGVEATVEVTLDR